MGQANMATTDLRNLILKSYSRGKPVRSRVFVLFGPRAAGKTVFIDVAVCGAADIDFGYDVEITEPNHDRTQETLSAHYQSLCSRSWPSATPFDAATIE